MPKSREGMIAETRAKLIEAGRKAFGAVGYANASMDDFTAEVGLTRGALYHHFGGKKGLLEAVLVQVEDEMAERLARRVAEAPDSWQGFIDENVGYVEMALEPEIQRIVFLDSPAILGEVMNWPVANSCMRVVSTHLRRLHAEGQVTIDPEGGARLIIAACSSAAQWIANSTDKEATSRLALDSLRAFLEGLRIKK